MRKVATIPAKTFVAAKSSLAPGFYFYDTMDGSYYPEGGKFDTLEDILKIDTNTFYHDPDNTGEIDNSMGVMQVDEQGRTFVLENPGSPQFQRFRRVAKGGIQPRTADLNSLTFKYIEQSGLSKDQVVARASALMKAMIKDFGPGAVTLQSAVDQVIDSAIEHSQGSTASDKIAAPSDFGDQELVSLLKSTEVGQSFQYKGNTFFKLNSYCFMRTINSEVVQLWAYDTNTTSFVKIGITKGAIQTLNKLI